MIIELDDHTFTDDIKDALCNMMSEPVVIREVEDGHLAIMFNQDGYIKVIDKFIGN